MSGQRDIRGGVTAYGRGVERTRRRHAYFWLMGSCFELILLAWNVVRLWSVPAAVVMSVVAAVIPPAAVIVGNLGSMAESELPRRDDQTDLDDR
jgi:hypothetical protein